MGGPVGKQIHQCRIGTPGCASPQPNFTVKLDYAISCRESEVSIIELAERFPDVRTVRSRSIALAALDAVISAEWASRWYSFDLTWGEREELGSMRNGSGDEYSIVFAESGVFVRGFDHDSVMSPYKRKPNSLWPGLVERIPESFLEFVNEPAFSAESGVPLMTICLWRGRNDDAGALEMLRILQQTLRWVALVGSLRNC